MRARRIRTCSAARRAGAASSADRSPVPSPAASARAPRARRPSRTTIFENRHGVSRWPGCDGAPPSPAHTCREAPRARARSSSSGTSCPSTSRPPVRPRSARNPPTCVEHVRARAAMLAPSGTLRALFVDERVGAVILDRDRAPQIAACQIEPRAAAALPRSGAPVRRRRRPTDRCCEQRSHGGIEPARPHPHVIVGEREHCAAARRRSRH